MPVTEGTVDFIVDGTIAFSTTVDGSGNAVYMTTLPLGTHTIVASYEVDPNFNASMSHTERVTIVSSLPSHSFFWGR